jgi:hypothetical protein
MSDGRRYDDEDVRAVIERALERQPGTGVSHSDLLEIGAELGLSAEAIERASKDVVEARLGAETAKRVTARRRRWLAAHALLFAVLNGLLFLVNLLSTPGEWWVLFPVFIWGLVLLLHAGLTFSLSAKQTPARLRVQQPHTAPAQQRQRVAPASADEIHADADPDDAKPASAATKDLRG